MVGLILRLKSAAQKTYRDKGREEVRVFCPPPTPIMPKCISISSSSRVWHTTG